MSALHEAAQLALEALEYGQHSLKQISEYQWESRGQLAMDALKAALSQPEPAQEPVAVVRSVVGQGDKGVRIKWLSGFPQIGDRLYTAPQPQRPPLTDEEIDRLWHDNGAGIDAERFVRIARAIERKVRGEA